MSARNKCRVEVFIRELLKTVRDIYYAKVTIILFGGRARGTSSDSGDFDIMVVLDEVQDPLEEAIKIRRKLKVKDYPLDLVVVDKSDIEKPIIRKMLESHKILYDGLKIGEKIARLGK